MAEDWPMGAHDRYLAQSAKERGPEYENHHPQCPNGENEGAECLCAELDREDARKRKKKRKDFGKEAK